MSRTTSRRRWCCPTGWPSSTTGRIEQIDPPEVLYEEPERAFVARFIGENNLVHGTVLALHDGFCDVDVAGVTVRAACIAPLEVGERTTMAIRPERVGVGDPSGRFANEFEATVDDITFLGDHLRVNLTIGEINDFVAKIPNVTGQGGVLEGDRVRVGWAALNCRALEAAAEVPSAP